MGSRATRATAWLETRGLGPLRPGSTGKCLGMFLATVWLGLLGAFQSATAAPFDPRLEPSPTDRNVVRVTWCGSGQYDVSIARSQSTDQPFVPLPSGDVSYPACEYLDVDVKAGTNYHYELVATEPGAPSETVLLSTLPEHPINDRRDEMVAAINTSYALQAEFTRPHIPPHATSADGRLAFPMRYQRHGDLNLKPVYLFAPEKLSVPFSQSGDGPSVMATAGYGQPNDCAQPIPDVGSGPNGCALPIEELFDPSQTWLDPTSVRISMSTVCDPTHASPGGQLTKSPFACGADKAYDCYDVTLVSVLIDRASSSPSNDPVNLSELWGRKVRVVVSNPKTSLAQIHKIVPLGTAVAGPRLPSVNLAEPMVTGDGRLLVGRGAAGFYWTNENDQPPSTQRYGGSQGSDLFYAVYPESDPPCDVSRWQTKTVWRPDGTEDATACAADQPGPMPVTGQHEGGRYIACESPSSNFYPISHAPYHAEMKARYGFAQYPFKDSEGNPIPDGRNSYLSYPWIDRGGKNIFFTHSGTMLHYKYGTEPLPANPPVGLRYPAACPDVYPGCNLAEALDPDDPDNFAQKPNLYEWKGDRGIGVMGLWTHGKAVFLDNNLNHIDYGLEAGVAKHRAIELYEPATGPAGTEDSHVHIGSGRENASNLPLWSGGNSHFLQSLENLWHGLPRVTPRTPRDVVWRMSSGVATDELVFDDYLDKGMLIFSDMRASYERIDETAKIVTNARGTWIYRDGFQSADWLDHGAMAGLGFLDTPRVANQATSPLLSLPSHGALMGAMSRIEPIAMGGVVGRGLWMNGASRIDYVLPSEPQYGGDWLVGIFVDPRPTADEGPATPRRLFEFPNGDTMDLIADPAGSGSLLEALRLTASGVTRDVPLPDLHSDLGWGHLAFGISAARDSISVFLDGYPVEIVNDLPVGAFELEPSAPGQDVLSVGGAAAAGVRGWLDDLRVQKMVGFDPAQICGFARGRLSQVGPGSDWLPAADAYGNPGTGGHAIVNVWLERAPTDSYQYVCFHDWSTRDALPVDEPSDHALTDVRDEILFPEGPVVATAPRPSGSDTNGFCLSCHDAGLASGLGMAALSYDASLPAMHDPRRQPSQPPPRSYGHIPADMYGPGRPVDPLTSPRGGCATDLLALSTGYVTGAWCPPTCSDGVDNDGDGSTDYPADSSCEAADSDREITQCSDGADNDGDGLVDTADPDCAGEPSWPSESPLGCGVGFELVLVLPILMMLRRRRPYPC